MPNYEYRCTSCDNLFEIWQEVGSEAPPCPECQSEVKKVFHPIRTIFKGSGFYVTDLRAENKAREAASAPAESKPETATPPPAAKSETNSKPSAS